MTSSEDLNEASMVEMTALHADDGEMACQKSSYQVSETEPKPSVSISS